MNETALSELLEGALRQIDPSVLNAIKAAFSAKDAELAKANTLVDHLREAVVQSAAEVVKLAEQLVQRDRLLEEEVRVAKRAEAQVKDLREEVRTLSARTLGQQKSLAQQGFFSGASNVPVLHPIENDNERYVLRTEYDLCYVLVDTGIVCIARDKAGIAAWIWPNEEACQPPVGIPVTRFEAIEQSIAEALGVTVDEVQAWHGCTGASIEFTRLPWMLRADLIKKYAKIKATL